MKTFYETSLFLLVISTTIRQILSETIEIDYRLPWSAVELFYNFIENEVFADSLLQHGCWCAKLNPANGNIKNLGGPLYVDSVDSICKQWARARHCSKVEGAVCEGFTSVGMERYKIENNEENVAFCTSTNQCLNNTCKIDLYYLTMIVDWLESENGMGGSTIGDGFVPVSNPTCGEKSGVNPTSVDHKRVQCAELVLPIFGISSFDFGFLGDWGSEVSTVAPVTIKSVTTNSPTTDTATSNEPPTNAPTTNAPTQQPTTTLGQTTIIDTTRVPTTEAVTSSEPVTIGQETTVLPITTEIQTTGIPTTTEAPQTINIVEPEPFTLPSLSVVCIILEVSSEARSPEVDTVDSVEAFVDYENTFHEISFLGPLEFGKSYTRCFQVNTSRRNTRNSKVNSVSIQHVGGSDAVHFTVYLEDKSCKTEYGMYMVKPSYLGFWSSGSDNCETLPGSAEIGLCCSNGQICELKVVSCWCTDVADADVCDVVATTTAPTTLNPTTLNPTTLNPTTIPVTTFGLTTTLAVTTLNLPTKPVTTTEPTTTTQIMTSQLVTTIEFLTTTDPVDNCFPNPCQNNGTCAYKVRFNTPTGAVCTCAEGFTGSFCSVQLPCALDPCQFNGTKSGYCFESETDDLSEYTCNCFTDFTGQWCEQQLNDPCTVTTALIPNPCSNDALCSPSEDMQSFSCNCNGTSPGTGVSDYIGEYCDVGSTCGLTPPCLNGGICEDLNTYSRYLRITDILCTL